MLDRWALEVAPLEHELAVRRAARRCGPAHFREAEGVNPTSTMATLHVVRGNHHEGIHRLGPLDLTP
jgi:hypothetical protein